MGVTGGKTFTYSNIPLAANGIVYWGPYAQGFMLSLDGCDYSGTGEVLTFNPALSNLAGGIAVWTGSTQIYNAQYYYYQSLPNTSLTLTVTDGFGAPLALTSAASLGLDANIGAVLEVTAGMTFNTNRIFKVDNTPAYEYYNAYPTSGNNACTSMYTGFYYNQPPGIGNIVNQLTQLNTNFGPLPFGVYDPEGSPDALALSVASSDPEVIPADRVVFSGSGSTRYLTITPLENVYGTTTLTVTVTDAEGLSASDSFNFMVNSPPLLTKNVQLEVNRGEGGIITSDHLAATDAESGASDLIFTVGPGGNGGPPYAGGTLLRDGTPLATGGTFTQADIDSGLITYAHDDSCALFDGFQFDVTDPHGGSAVAITGYPSYSFGFKILMPNRPPVAANGSISVPMGNLFNGTLTATNPDCATQELTFRIVTNGTRGTAALVDVHAGTFTYTPAPGESGTDSFTFQVNDGITDALIEGTVSVAIENQKPAGQATAFATREGASVSGTLTATDLDLPPQTLSFRIGTNGTKGNAVINDPATGTVTYTPNPDAFGADTFTYVVNDGLLDSTPVTVTVTIAPQWDSGDLLISNGNTLTLYDPTTGAQAVVASGEMLANLHGLALESGGTALVLSETNGLIRINPLTGQQTQLVTGLAFPVDVAVEANGNILVSSGPQGVLRYSPSGVLLETFSGNNITFSSGLAIAVDGTIYVGDAGAMAGSTNKIVSIDPTTGAQAVVTNGGSLGLPIGIALDGAGNLYVADAGPIANPALPSQIVKVVLADGTQSVVTTAGDLAAPADVIVRAGGGLLATNIMGGALVGINPDTGEQNILTSGGVLTSAWAVEVIPAVDADADGITNFNDNCPLVSNSDQLDSDGDRVGDSCDADADGDGVANVTDNCPLAANADQLDTDGDGIGNACDADDDNDTVADGSDNCPLNTNADQLDTDSDTLGNACDADDDGDGVPDVSDAFPLNPGESADTDGDGIGNNSDNCLSVPNPDQADVNINGLGDACDPADSDGDGLSDREEWVYGTDPAVADQDLDQQTDGSDSNPFDVTVTGATPTPLNDDAEFVKQIYRDFLNREAEEGGLNYWVTQLSTGARTRAAVVEEYLLSPEFGEKIAPVVRLYFAYFNRLPDYGGLMYWVGEYTAGARTLENISDFFAGSDEFQATYGSLDNAGFVTLVYQNVLGRAPDAGGLAFWTNELNAGNRTRGQVMTGFSESIEYRQQMGNEVYVTMVYIGLLRRAPEQSGFDYWVGRMDQGNSGQELIIDLFLGSAEYAARFDGSTWTVPTITYAFPYQWQTVVEDEDVSGDGAADNRYTTVYAYNADQMLTQTVESYDNDLDATINATVTTSYSYDSYGNPQAVIRSNDWNNDGTPDSLWTTTYETDVYGNVIHRYESRDYDADGTAEIVLPTLYTWNGDGLLSQQVTATDGNDDGLPDQVETIRYSYNANGQLIGMLTERDSQNDGVPEAIIEETLAWNGSGQLTTWETAVDTNGDTLVDRLETTTLSYDGSGKLLSAATAIDVGANGSTEDSETVALTYDGSGNVVGLDEAMDNGNDGTSDYLNQKTLDYTTVGMPVGLLLRNANEPVSLPVNIGLLRE